ncbi:hypothetical protein GCM10022291_04510 [Postechiella marina]|uniref:Uncharacterized protein n=1 Tax=Postechiella marina TaxID=943941 RepID=A0ABP8C0L7_9FLAO
MLTTTMAKKNLNCEAKKVVKCQTIGKLNMPNSPNSSVKKPKTLIFKEDNNITKKGKIKDVNISILLVLFSKSFCNSKFSNRSILYVLVELVFIC